MQTRRAYKQFDGNSIFHFCGLCISGPDRANFRVTLVIMFVFAITFYAFIAPFFILMKWWGISVVFIGVCLHIFTLLNLLLSAYTDPGIIPRTTLPYDPNSPTPKSIEVRVGDIPLYCKFCPTCHIFRPPRATHCRKCNNCVDRFDHHCVWIGNCIGKRNYNHFLFFVTTTVLSIFYIIALSISKIVLVCVRIGDDNLGVPVLGNIINGFIQIPPYNLIGAFVLLLLCFLVMPPVFALCVMHFILVSLNQTTNEWLKGTFKETGSPYSFKFCCINWCYLFYPPHFPRYFNARKKEPIKQTKKDKQKNNQKKKRIEDEEEEEEEEDDIDWD